MFSGVSGGGVFFSETEVTAFGGVCSVTVVDNELATVEAPSDPRVEAIILGRDCR